MDGRLFARRTGALVLGGIWLFVAFVAGSFTGWSSEKLGWLWSMLAFAFGLVPAVLLWRPRVLHVAVGLAVAVSLVLGLVHWQSSPPTHDRIAEAADEVTVPAGWDLEYDSTRGNTWCFKGCPLVERGYAVPGSFEEAVVAATESFEDAGWTSSSVAHNTTTFRDGRWQATLSETYPYDGPVEVQLSFSG